MPFALGRPSLINLALSALRGLTWRAKPTRSVAPRRGGAQSALCDLALRLTPLALAPPLRAGEGDPRRQVEGQPRAAGTRQQDAPPRSAHSVLGREGRSAGPDGGRGRAPRSQASRGQLSSLVRSVPPRSIRSGPQRSLRQDWSEGWRVLAQGNAHRDLPERQLRFQRCAHHDSFDQREAAPGRLGARRQNCSQR